MKHWLLIGTILIIAGVLFMRSRISSTQTVPATMPGVGVSKYPGLLVAPGAKSATPPTTAPAKGVSIDRLPAGSVAVPTH